ncbi:hypothetical protein BS47DRAFT_963029 [Hydnum rufescens UP504]|uniref:Secreted protein n=1 Tax=Hydnum rufescens UP504 TaxID=1448309 RepID=A0A9P6AWY1_9AGAM|nr:hypothetical protein BS47DRAFT_963029 [Hydnum rufescens UP504]
MRALHVMTVLVVICSRIVSPHWESIEICVPLSTRKVFAFVDSNESIGGRSKVGHRGDSVSHPSSIVLSRIFDLATFIATCLHLKRCASSSGASSTGGERKHVILIGGRGRYSRFAPR